MSTDPTPEGAPLGRARDDLEAKQRQVALLELLSDRGVEIREASIDDTIDVDGTAVYLDVVIPQGGLSEVIDPIPSAEGRGLVNKIVPSPDSPEEAVDILDDYIAELEEGLDTLHEDVLDLEERIETGEHAHEATRLEDVDGRIQAVEAHVEAVAKRCSTIEERLESELEADTPPVPDFDEQAIEHAHENADAGGDENAVDGTLDEATVDKEDVVDTVEATTDTTSSDDQADSGSDEPELTAGELRSRVLATAFDDVADTIQYFDKTHLEALVDTHVPEGAPADPTTKALRSALSNEFEVDLHTNARGSLPKADVRALHDAITGAGDHANNDDDDETRAAGESTSASEDGGDVDADTTESAEANPGTDEDAETRDSATGPVNHHGQPMNKYELARHSALALGVKPPQGYDGNAKSYQATKRLLRDLAAALTTEPASNYQLSSKDELVDTIRDVLDSTHWTHTDPRHDSLLELYDHVVPHGRQGDEMTFEGIAADTNVDIPGWMDEASFHVAAGDASSLRELAHNIGWERDLQPLRRLTYLAGAYAGLPEPEAKQDSKYQVAAADGGGK